MNATPNVGGPAAAAPPFVPVPRDLLINLSPKQRSHLLQLGVWASEMALAQRDGQIVISIKGGEPGGISRTLDDDPCPTLLLPVNTVAGTVVPMLRKVTHLLHHLAAAKAQGKVEVNFAHGTPTAPRFTEWVFPA